MTLAVLVLDRGALEPQPEQDREVVAVAVRHTQKRLACLCRDDAEAAVVAADVDAQKERDELEIDPRGEEPEERMLLLLPLRENDVESLLGLLVEFGNQLRRVLEVTVHDDGPATPADRESGGDGGLLAEVAA